MPDRQTELRQQGLQGRMLCEGQMVKSSCASGSKQNILRVPLGGPCESRTCASLRYRIDSQGSVVVFAPRRLQPPVGGGVSLGCAVAAVLGYHRACFQGAPSLDCCDSSLTGISPRK